MLKDSRHGQSALRSVQVGRRLHHSGQPNQVLFKRKLRELLAIPTRLISLANLLERAKHGVICNGRAVNIEMEIHPHGKKKASLA